MKGRISGCVPFDFSKQPDILRTYFIKAALAYRGKTMDVKGFVYKVLEGLKAAGLYGIESESEVLSLSEAFQEEIDRTKLLNKDKKLNEQYKKELSDNYRNVLQRYFNVTLKSDPTEEAKSDTIPGDPDLSDPKTDTSEAPALSYSIDKMFEGAEGAKNFMLNLFKTDIVNAILVNFTKGARVSTTEDLNQNIADLKNAMFANLVKYLRNEDEDLGTRIDETIKNYIYKDGSPDIDNFQKVMKKAEEVFRDIKPSRITAAYAGKKLINPVKGTLTNEEFLNAYNAYVLLSGTNFDDLLSKLIPKGLVIKSIYKGEVALSKSKYKFTAANSFVNKWGSDRDGLDAIKLLGNVSKLLVESTPLLNSDYPGIERIGDRLLTIKEFMYVMNKLVDPYETRKLKEDPEFQKLATRIYTNPVEHVSAMLKYILDKEKLTKSERDIVKSVYERFFNPANKGQNGFHSLMAILIADQSTSKVFKDYSLLEVISGIIIRTNSAKYTQYKYNNSVKDITATEIRQSNSLHLEILRRNDIDILNEIRSDREDLLKNYQVEVADMAKGTMKFVITTSSGESYTFTYDHTKDTGDRLEVRTKSNISEFPNNLGLTIKEVDFDELSDIYDKLIGSEVSTELEKVYVELLKLVDSLLNTGFLRGNVDLLRAFKDATRTAGIRYLTESLMRLVSTALRANYLYNEYEKSDKSLTFLLFLKDHALLAFAGDKFADYYNEATNALSIGNVDNLSKTVIQKLAKADLVVRGDVYKTTVKNADGNNVPTNRISNLANLMPYYVETRIGSPENPAMLNPGEMFGSMEEYKGIGEVGSTITANLLAQDPKSFLGVSIKTDGISHNDKKKAVSKFTEAEHAYTSIVFDFYSNLIDSEDSSVQLQVTVYSDKPNIPLHRYTQQITLNGLPLDMLVSPTEDILEAYKNTIGKLYKDTYDRIFKIYRDIYAKEDIEKFLGRLELFAAEDSKVYEEWEKEYSAWSKSRKKDKGPAPAVRGSRDLMNIAASIRSKVETLNATNEVIAAENAEILLRNQELQKLKDLLNDLGEFEEAGEIKFEALKPTLTLSESLSNEEMQAILMVTTLDEFNDLAWDSGMKIAQKLKKEDPEKYGNIDDQILADLMRPEVVENLQVSTYDQFRTIDGAAGKYTFVQPNSLIIYKATKLYQDDNEFNAVVMRERKKFARDLIATQVSFPLRYSDGTENAVITQALKNVLDAYKWTNQNTQELYIAKVNGEFVTKLSPEINPDDDSVVELHPLLERYFAVYNLIAENTRIAMTGFEEAHPDKSKTGFKTTREAAELKEASCTSALSKRNVIVTGTKQNLQQKGLLGVPEMVRIAVMQDVEAPVFNPNGVSSKVDAHDGGILCDPLYSIMENLSLQDAAVGEDKKPIGHDFGPMGTATLLKCATFSMYNERMRNSQSAPINQYDLFRKMNSFSWQAHNGGNPVNLSLNLFGETLTLTDILGGEKLFYRVKNRYYQILSLESTGNPNEYKRTRIQVDKQGNSIGEQTLEDTLILDNNYDLHRALGGVMSQSLNENGELGYSDASLYTTVVYMNNVGEFLGGPNDLATQENTRQPLKHAMIAYVVNKSAIKVGAQHINKEEAWTDPNVPLRYLRYKTDGTGIQMDADHIVTDPEHQSTLTEFSQVISALEANGTVHNISKLAYKDLGKVALQSVADINTAVKEFQNSNFNPDLKTKIYEIVGRLLVKSILKDDRDVGIANEIAKKVREEFKKRNRNHRDDDFHIPFSDPSIFSKALATFTSAINSTAIKRKFPGLGAVMVPAYNMFMNFNIGGSDLSYDDVYQLASDANMTPLLWLDSKQMEVEEAGPLSIDNVMPTDIIKVLDDSGNVVKNDDDTDKIFVIDTMATYRMIKAAYKQFYPVVNKAKNLKPAEIYWTVKGRRYNIYDLYPVLNAFTLRETRKDLTKEEDRALQKSINVALNFISKGIMIVPEGTEGAFHINGTDLWGLNIDLNSLVNNPAEMILPAIYQSKFGITPGHSLHTVLSQGADYFIKLTNKKRDTKTNNYDLCFTREDGNHTYIVFKNSNKLKNLSANKLDTDFEYVREGLNLWRVDEDGNKLYRAGAYDLNTDELTMLVESYTTTDSDTVSEVLVINNIEGALELFNPREYFDIKFSPTASEETLNTIKEFIEKGAEEYSDIKDIKDTYYDKAKSYKDFLKSINDYTQKKIGAMAIKKFTSFLKSLEFTVARIPAQTLQSFMKMKVVQFSGSQKNSVHVSHWQTWLQGSDYKQHCSH